MACFNDVCEGKNLSEFGLYIHIPFCASLCHYCDFAKTALYNEQHVSAYFAKLREDLAFWFERTATPITSVFFGGGTPGLFAAEYTSLMDAIHERLAPGAEVSLEANPNNITAEKLALWRSLGFNRLSIGAQSFDEVALRFLTRDHDARSAQSSITAAMTFFPSLNIDLIYGWENQTLRSWDADLATATSLGVPHLSLYCLTYEDGTTLGRKLRRGVVSREVDDALAKTYDLSCATLDRHGYRQEEVSNWAKPGFSCRHNWLYWSDKYFIGIGAGAHGYVADESLLGLRYSYPKDLRRYLKGEQHVIDPRSKDDWLLEYVGASLRSERGTSLALVERKAGLRFKANQVLTRGIDEGLVTIDSAVRLKPSEWFREAAWALELLDSLS